MGSTKRWYQNPSTLISVVALSFSFSTTYVSYRRADVQDIQASRQELRGLLLRLAALPKENIELTKKYADDPAAQFFVGGQLTQETAFLSRQAAEIALQLPRGRDSADEYYAGLKTAYDLEAAGDLLNRAAESASGFNTEIAVLRMMADMQFDTGRQDDGRITYQRAKSIFSQYTKYDPYTIASTGIWTELVWASSEARVNQSTLTRQHLENAENILGTLQPGLGTDSIRAQVLQARAQYERSGLITSPIPTIIPPATQKQ